MTATAFTRDGVSDVTPVEIRRRVGAAAVDWTICSVAYLVVSIPLGALEGLGSNLRSVSSTDALGVGLVALAQIATVLPIVLYFTLGLREGHTLGMAAFDFKTLLPALLQVEDRVSMAHGLESRVPLLDHPLVELAATMPADVKFRDGHLKHVLKTAFAPVLPDAVRNRRDKMGFPVPLQEWIGRDGSVRDFVVDTLSTDAARNRGLVDNAKVVAKLDQEPRFGRKVWGLLSLELWQQSFHDRAASFRKKAEALA